MDIHFWGVRGSIPAPTSPSRIKSKISAILEQVTAEDIIDAESRERFLAGLPPWLFGTVGGNSPCVSIMFEDSNECIIFDCGSGIREMGMANFSAKLPAQGNEKRKLNHFHVFFSHFHWDHIQGLPFFGPAYNPSNSIDFYSPVPDIENILNNQMIHPYFPIHLDSMGAKKTYHQLNNEINISGRTISFKKMNHPGDSYSYCVNDNGKRIIYATDTELTPADFLKNDENTAFFENADMIIIDCQYTLGEAIDKYNWGHSAFSLAVDFAANWRIKHMIMFHHDPTYDDHKLYGILQSARWYLERMNLKGIELTLATEGLEISV
ncbi:MAG: MBL fold metallo-hydrolase [Treponema sp.]|jgi:phosphoribosyl 1,2-cyclic phosphodiesterase|nr:MBL fold metallo-hydrolase [Treponema sp.]